METHFIADLHLQPGRPALTALFLAYLAGPARAADQLYILGDLFEYWIGDDGSMPDYPQVVQALTELANSGTTLYVQHGNRDFMLGSEFCAATGATILDDPVVISLGGEAVLISHGDLFCTDDHDHQRFRERYTDPAWRARMQALPIWLRRLIARYARWRSRRGHRHKSATIMDVNQDTVERWMHRRGCRRLVHGHTHRPANHEWRLGGAQAQRHVLSDWDEHRGGEALVVRGGELTRLPLQAA